VTTVNLIPPSDGQHNSISINGRTYSTTSGVAIPVQDFDAAVLQANGWTIQANLPSLSSPTVLDTSGIPEIFHVAATLNPASPSSAITDCLRGDIIYPAAAPAIIGAGHMIGALGRIINNNTTNPIGLAIGVEGKIDNAVAGAAMTTAISLDANFGSNLGTITSWYGVYADLGSNAGLITKAVGFGLNVDSNPGVISNLYGFYFPPLGAQANIPVVIGYFFDNNPGMTGLKYAMYCADTTALIASLGPIQTAALLTAATFQLDTGVKTAAAVAGAATLNKASGKITTESLTTAAGATYTLTLTNSQIAAADTAFVSIANGTNSAGDPAVGLVTPAAGSVTIKVVNRHASAALNGTLVISFASMKA
jgi:hypothetical protein